jgi:two-component system, cell cycle sensor histidine kinase and response regulator CckA
VSGGATVSVLHLEDDPRDARLIRSQIALEGIACVVTRVDREADYLGALERGGFDIILADHALPDFDLLSALAMARQICPDVPFICVSGSIGEDLALETLKIGATDYVLKQRMSRLGPALRRALEERAERMRRREAEAAVTALEAQLRHSQKLEAVGRLAGGIAHDFNNLLTVINGTCERLMADVDEQSRLRTDLDLIYQSSQRAANLTRQLLAFGRRQALETRRVDLNDIVRDIARILERVLGERIKVVTSLDPALGAVEADPGQIEQVLMNLAINARDAMPEGGTVTIETANVEAGPDDRDMPSARPPGRWVQLAVRDTGHGMDETTAAHALEPFFTTKAPGEGTGLGLSTANGIVAESGGHLAIESSPGVGTTMRVFLPRVESARAPVPLASVPVPAASGHERLLLVEDEEFVRELVRDFLLAAGYQVLESASAEDALSLVARNRTPIDLLVTDVVLPGMNGTELADQLRRQMPGMETLYMSGYAGDSMFGEEVFEPGAAFLPKPFTRHLLTRKVREVLNARHRGTVLDAAACASLPATPLGAGIE